MLIPFCVRLSPDPFLPFLDRKPPAIVRVLGEETKDGVLLRRVVFRSRIVQAPSGPVPSNVYALIVRPQAGGRYPGMLVLHGGMQTAVEEKAIGWAKRGYVAVAPDLPGIADPGKTPNSEGSWKEPYASRHMFAGPSEAPDVTQSTVFDGVVAALQSLWLLRAQPGVLPAKLGVAGVSWGGYATTMVCGLAGKDVRAAFSVYGSGFFDRGSFWADALKGMSGPSREAWLRYLDAGRRAPGIRANFFMAAAANDTYFWPPAVEATLGEISSPKNQLFAPNSDHWAKVPGGTESWGGDSWLLMEQPYFDYLLKGIGRPLPVARLLGSLRQADGSVKITARVEGGSGALKTSIWFSSEGPWPKRTWIEAVSTSDGKGLVTGIVPAEAAKGSLDVLCLVSDSRPVTVSSLIRHIAK